MSVDDGKPAGIPRGAAILAHHWFLPRLSPGLWPLLPLSGLFAGLASLRRLAYRRGWLKTCTLPVPVIVVGNITVGGSGKTPLVAALAKALRQRGEQPGIISRGHGRQTQAALVLTADSDARQAGDEPLLLRRRSDAPLAVGRDRPAAGSALLAAHPECTLLLSDDGLQHYRLGRTFEIATFDSRAAGNGWLLPAGPLREPIDRLRQVDAVVWNGPAAAEIAAQIAAMGRPQFSMQLQAGDCYQLNRPEVRLSLAQLAAHCQNRRLYAIAGIGHPQRFFEQLRCAGLEFVARPFADHHAYTAEELSLAEHESLLMTEKDAVKCAGLCPGDAWVLPVSAILPAGLIDLIMEKLNGCTAA